MKGVVYTDQGDKPSLSEMQHHAFSQDEHMAATAVAALAGSKHERTDNEGQERDCKMARMEIQPSQDKPAKKPHVIRVLRPAPFFFYKDFSEVPDPDPLTPLTAPGRVPNFPAKMHAILSRSELREIVAWQPHGRSWKVLKPREFEIKVLPKFFEHAKFSSFVRQANGWGFRRISKGRDRNSYYHETFLRGLPHLSKDMKRPGVAEKKACDPAHEPDLYAISKIHPLPENIEEDEAILLQCTLQGGPRARVPIYSGAMGTLSAAALPKKTELMQPPSRDPFALNPFPKSIAAPESTVQPRRPAAATPQAPQMPAASLSLPPFFGAASSSRSIPPFASQTATMSALTPANHLAFPTGNTAPITAALNASAAASQFAAGFAAATAFSQHQFRNILDNLAQQRQHPNQHQNGSQHLNQNNGFPPSGV